MAADLISLAQAKDYLSIKNTDDDPLLARLIKSASSFIENYTNRSLLQGAYAEKYSGGNTSRILLRQTPVISVSAVSIFGAPVLPSPDGQSPGYAFDSVSVVYLGRRFPEGFNNVAISYTAGYAVIPEDMQQACQELVALEYRERSRTGKTSETTSQGGTTAYSVEALSKRTKAVLDNYKRWYPA